MNCTNCKNPIQENTNECEWCNYIIRSSEYNSPGINKKIINKGECIFFSKRITKTKCFYELYDNGIKIFDDKENINLFIQKNIIYNIEHFRRFKLLHFIPLVGSLIRFVILFFFKYKKGYSLITSKSGRNVIIIKKSNYRIFNILMMNYLKFN